MALCDQNMARRYRVRQNIGRVKYLVSFHDGVKTHQDGSPFFDIKCFSKQRKMRDFTRELDELGYLLTF